MHLSQLIHLYVRTFLVKSFLGNFYKHLAIFSGHTGSYAEIKHYDWLTENTQLGTSSQSALFQR